MAPKRKQTTPEEAAPVVRRSARLSSAAVAADPEPPKKKQTKPKAETKTKAETKAKAKAKAETKTKASSEEEGGEAVEKAEGAKTIVIEHCKQCTQFKRRAMKVKEELEKEVAGVNVVVNGEKPRRGCFEIREEGGEVFVSLLGMKRPFPPLKTLDMDKLISDILHKIR
ncbi:hypothetical protein SASPL_121064 [Salvia splendens]|uniref:Selenoprotein H n=1 Tax=Salvia splendens TaxID=180675 RepID=A0A8X8ZVV3_SALSN|nr:uncharacterized protein LOC121810659 [Salvia splendens]KAG6418858.1 hypothetical protein SASPL_121064 [Salvia splendens]